MSCRKIYNCFNQNFQVILFTILFLSLFASIASARVVTLTWDPNSEPDLNSYVVYWGVTPGNYTDNSGDIGLVNEYSVTIPDDGQTYFFAVTAVDTSGLESDFSNEVNTGGASIQVLPINSNWNLISIAGGAGVTPIEDALAPIMDGVISVWAYDNGSWRVYDPSNPGFSDLLEVAPGQGLWVNMRDNAELTIPGDASVVDVDLSEGWNLVGFNSTASRNMSDAIASIDGNVESVWAYQNGQWKVYDPQNPGFSDLTSMDPGYGYWIKVNTPCLWSY